MTELASRNVEVFREGCKARVVPSGNVVASVAQPFKPKLKDLVHDGVNMIEFDLSRSTIVDSVGIGLFVAAHNSVQKAGGTISIVNASADLLHLFKVLRLDQRFSVTGM